MSAVSARRAAILLALVAAAVGALVVAVEALRVPATPPGPMVVEQRVEEGRRSDPCETAGAPPVEVRSADLLRCPTVLDQRVVVVQGELVGDLLGVSQHRWVHLNDDAYARQGPLDSHHRTLGTNSGIAVLLPQEIRPQVLGGPGVWGDRVRVVGRFSVAAAEDQGGAAIIADVVTPLARGGRVPSPPASAQRVAAVILGPVAIGLWWRTQRHRL